MQLTAAEVALLTLAVRVRGQELEALESRFKAGNEASEKRYAEAVTCIWDAHQVAKDWKVEMKDGVGRLVPPEKKAE